MIAQDERALERDLQAVRRAWSEFDSVEPPALLDQAVLNAARRAVGASQSRSSRIGRWSGAFAAAAVIVLAVTVVVQQERVDTLTAPEATPPERDAPGPSATQRALQAAPEALSADAARGVSEERPRERMEATAKTADAELFELEDAAAPDPDSWIERLRTLQAAGDLEVFRAERDAFQATYPDYELPDDLRSDLRADPQR